MTGCEVIGEGEQLIPVAGEITSGRKHVLLEFTGFRCVNCPTAAQQAQALHEIYGGNLIVVALHPASNHFTQGKKEYDYTCPAADSIYQYMGGNESTPFPTGNIDLTPREGKYFFDNAEWPALMVQAMEDTVAPSMTMTAMADTLTRDINVHVFAQAQEKTEVRIAVWLVADSIQGMQAMPDGSVRNDYMHRHVLRSTLNDKPWGEPMTIDGTIRTLSGKMQIPDTCRAEQCSLVAMIIDKNDNHILQAYETKLDYYDDRRNDSDER